MQYLSDTYQVAKTNLFTANVGNLPPGKEVLIFISYITDLDFENGQVKLVLPNLAYAPDGNLTPKFEMPSNVSGPYSKDVGFGLKIDAELEMTSPIKTISSTSHQIQHEVFIDSFGSTNHSSFFCVDLKRCSSSRIFPICASRRSAPQ
jgi:hypothetical protein